MAIQNTTLTTTPVSIVDETGERAVTVVYFYNSDLTAVELTVHAVSNGDTAGNENKIYGGLTIESTDTYIIDTEKLLLNDGDTLYASANVANVVIATASFTAI
jgi:hypothetical protein